MLTGRFDLRCRACSYTARDLDEAGARAAIGQHYRDKSGGSHTAECTERLPPKPIVGDRVHIKSDLQGEFERLYGVEASKVHVVEKEFDRKLYGEAMFALARKGNKPQIIVRPGQIELAWRNDEERRAGLEEFQRRVRAA